MYVFGVVAVVIGWQGGNNYVYTKWQLYIERRNKFYKRGNEPNIGWHLVNGATKKTQSESCLARVFDRGFISALLCLRVVIISEIFLDKIIVAKSIFLFHNGRLFKPAVVVCALVSTRDRVNLQFFVLNYFD